MHDVRVGVVGYGLAGRLFHAPFIVSTPGLVLRAVVTRNAVGQLQQDHPGVAAVDSLDALLQQDVDLVVVASPSGLHDEHARAALEAGKHVVLDKPPSATAGQFEALCELADSVDRQLIVFHNRRWDSDFRTLQSVLPELGTVHRFETRFERWRPGPKGGWRESSAPQELGGLRYDLGPHLVDQALQLFGPVESVWARSQSPRGIGAQDDDVLATLVHECGVTTLLSASLVTALPGPRFVAYGSAGAAVLRQPDGQEDRLRAGDRPGPGWGAEPGRVAIVATGERPDSREVPYLDGQWPAFYSGVAACLRHGAPPPVSPESALATMRVLDAIGDAARKARS